MSSPQTSNRGRSWALLFTRLVLGLIFFMAGVYKVFQLGPLQHARKYFLPFADTFLPVWSLWATGVVIPFVELVAGGLVMLGLRTREALRKSLELIQHAEEFGYTRRFASKVILRPQRGTESTESSWKQV